MGIGAIVGGALKGYGDGMAEVARSKEEERRLSALENLRTKNDQTTLGIQADYQDRNASRSDQRGDFYDARKTERTTDAQVKIDGARTVNDMTLEDRRAANAKSLATHNSKLNITEAQYQSGLRIAEEEAAAGRTISTWETDDNGNLVGVRPNGSRVYPGVKPMPDAPKGGGSSLLLNNSPTPAPAAAKTPAPSKQVAQTGGAPRLRDDAAAEAFVSNPANKGKPFIGPDGKQYKVPN